MTASKISISSEHKVLTDDSLMVCLFLLKDDTLIAKYTFIDEEAEIEDVCDRIAKATGQHVDNFRNRIAAEVCAARSSAAQNSQPERSGGSKFDAEILDSAAFAAREFRLEWLVERVLVRGQPGAFGGTLKSFKTSIAVDLSISLGTATPFLGKFTVPKAARVLFLSGESGGATLQDTARRVCAAKGVDLRCCKVSWGFDLPQLSADNDVSRLGHYCRREQIEVVLLDPLYLCLSGVDALGANMYTMGSLLRAASKACLDAGATPILVHHTSRTAGKARSKDSSPLDLVDLAYAGLSEFARQWLLVSLRSPFDSTVGTRELWLRVGGSAGHHGLWGLNIDEGYLDESFGGRQWVVRIDGVDDVLMEVATKKQEAKNGIRLAKIENGRGQIMQLLQTLPQGETVSSIQRLSGLPKAIVSDVISGLADETLIIPCHVRKAAGRGSHEHAGWRLAAPDESAVNLGRIGAGVTDGQSPATLPISAASVAAGSTSSATTGQRDALAAAG